jgi:Domain of unknown function (DUF4145)
MDRATKLLWARRASGDQTPKKLSPRIQALRAKLEIPKTIADWAHTVRIVGNELYDIDDVEEADALDAGHFAEVFLTYTCTLPERLRAFRARRNSDDAPAPVA